nr:hypothetical protein CFP56_70212 [Quercus suber]
MTKDTIKVLRFKLLRSAGLCLARWMCCLRSRLRYAHAATVVTDSSRMKGPDTTDRSLGAGSSRWCSVACGLLPNDLPEQAFAARTWTQVMSQTSPIDPKCPDSFSSSTPKHIGNERVVFTTTQAEPRLNSSSTNHDSYSRTIAIRVPVNLSNGIPNLTLPALFADFRHLY